MNKYKASNIYNNLLNIIYSKGLTVKKMCNDLNISESTITRWRNSDTRPYISTLNKICEYLKIELDELLNDKKNKSVSVSNSFNNANSNINSTINSNNQFSNIDIFKNDNILKMYTRLSTDNKNKVHEFITNLFINQNLGE